jgi:biopolymer transport protein ExbB
MTRDQASRNAKGNGDWPLLIAANNAYTARLDRLARRLGRRLILCVACLCWIGVMADVVRAQSDIDPNDPGRSERTFDQVQVSVPQQLEQSLAELAALREAIAAEKVPLGRRLRELEDELIEVRREYQQTTRELDTRTLNLSNLRTEIESRREEKTYLFNLLSEYIRNFEARLHIAELQRFSEPLEAAKLAPENANLSETEVYQAQAALVAASLDRLHDALGGSRYEGKAVDNSGLVKPGTFVMVGPAALFQSADGQSVGTAEQRLGSLEPTVLAFDADAVTQAAAELVSTGTGQFPLDPTLGNAHKIEATKQTLGEHIAKGGPVMYPILGLFAAAMLLALFKWIELARMRNPSQSRISALLQAVARHDEEQAAHEARTIGGPAGEMLLAGVDHIKEPPDLVEEVMYEKILTAKLKIHRFLPFIAISAAAAPLLGLLGTVTGIINTFKLITVFGSGDVKTLSGGISEALITTEFGLIVAIPSLLLHAFLSRKARGLVDRMDKAAIALINQLNRTPYRQDRGVDVAPGLPPATLAQEMLRRANPDYPGRQEIRELVRYSENSAGAMMDSPVLSVGRTATVAEAIGKIRAAETDDDFETVFVVDEHGKYVGNVPVRHLLTRPEQTSIEVLMDTNTLFVRVDADRDEVQKLLTKHDRITVPVIDHDGQLVGRIRSNGE